LHPLGSLLSLHPRSEAKRGDPINRLIQFIVLIARVVESQVAYQLAPFSGRSHFFFPYLVYIFTFALFMYNHVNPITYLSLQPLSVPKLFSPLNGYLVG
jgi:hypothetical protein